jgi:hypothetical protein
MFVQKQEVSALAPENEIDAIASKKPRVESDKDMTAKETITNDDAPPKFVGKFDLSGITLPFLKTHYVPEGHKASELLKFQAKADYNFVIEFERTGVPPVSKVLQSSRLSPVASKCMHM